MTNEELKGAVRYWFERNKHDLTCHEEEQQEGVMRLAAERFSETVITGAKARVWLLREEAVVLITQKNRAKLDLNQAVSNGYSPELIRQLVDVYEPLYRQVVEIKVRVKRAEINAREQTEKWLAERKDEG